MTRHSKIGLALLVAFVAGFAGGAGATSFSLGNISGPGTFSFGNNKDPGPFVDKVHFIIDPGVMLDFTAFATTGFSNRSWILDMDGTLSDASGVILDADAVTLFAPEGFPKRDVNYPKTLLGPGHYFLSIFGTATHAFPGPSSPYSGSITFAATPLPASLLFMLTALGASGLLGWRRIGKSADAAA